MITARTYQLLRHRDRARLQARLRQTQFWSPDRIRRYQFLKLKRMLRHAYRNVPYYRRMMDDCGAVPADIRNFDDFARLPVLTKSDIRQNVDAMVDARAPADRLVANATSGSTGQPLRFYQDERYELWADAARTRGWYEMAGCRRGDRCAVLWGAMNDIKTDYSLAERLRDLFLDGEVKLNSGNLSDRRKEAFLRWCRALRPRLLRGYFTAVKELARYLDQSGGRFCDLRGIVLCAEMGDEPSREYIERVFRTRSYNAYGCREVSLIAMECSCRTGLHEVSENNYVEFESIDLPGYPGAGNLIVTNLNNYAMPFVRYRIGDIGVPGSDSVCECGRGQPRMAKVIGRTTEVFHFHDGTKIAGEMFIHLMKDLPVDEYQFVQVSDSKVVLRLKRREAADEQLREIVLKTFRDYLPCCVPLDFEAVDRFEPTAAGKFRFVFVDPELANRAGSVGVT
ncbi:MAG: hypothetical protein ABIP48_07155 [Planctomycetota bacterium]